MRFLGRGETLLNAQRRRRRFWMRYIDPDKISCGRLKTAWLIRVRSGPIRLTLLCITCKLLSILPQSFNCEGIEYSPCPCCVTPNPFGHNCANPIPDPRSRRGMEL